MLNYVRLKPHLTLHMYRDCGSLHALKAPTANRKLIGGAPFSLVPYNFLLLFN